MGCANIKSHEKNIESISKKFEQNVDSNEKNATSLFNETNQNQSKGNQIINDEEKNKNINFLEKKKEEKNLVFVSITKISKIFKGG